MAVGCHEIQIREKQGLSHLALFILDITVKYL